MFDQTLHVDKTQLVNKDPLVNVSWKLDKDLAVNKKIFIWMSTDVKRITPWLNGSASQLCIQVELKG